MAKRIKIEDDVTDEQILAMSDEDAVKAIMKKYGATEMRAWEMLDAARNPDPDDGDELLI